MFRKNVALLAGGTAAGQGFVVIASPLLTRLYGPDDFGAFAVYLAILGIVAVVASLRYELAIPLPKDENSAACLLVLSFFIVLCMSVLSMFVLWLFGDSILDWFQASSHQPFLWLLPFGIMGTGIFKSLNFWGVRRKYFSQIARSKISQGLGVALIQIGLGLVNFCSFGLVAGHAVGQFSGISALIAQVLKQDKATLKTVSPHGLLRVLIEYQRFPLFSSWSAIFNTMSTQIPVLMFSFFFGPTITGLYTLGLRVVQTPVGLVGQAISQVFLSTAAEKNREGQLALVTLSVFKRLVQIGLPVMLVIGIAAPEIFAIIFGRDWRVAGDYTQWLSPWLFFVFVSSPLSIVPSVLGKQSQEVVFNGSLLVSRVIVIYIFGVLQDSTLAIIFFSVTSTFFYICFMLWIMKISGNQSLIVLNIILKETIMTMPLLLPLIISKIVFNKSIYDVYICGIALLSMILIAYKLFNSLNMKSIMLKKYD